MNEDKETLAQQIDRAAVAAAVFEAAEASGYRDRTAIEGIVRRVIARLEAQLAGATPLPGFEALVPSGRLRGAGAHAQALREALRQESPHLARALPRQTSSHSRTRRAAGRGDGAPRPPVKEKGAMTTLAQGVSANAMTVLERRYLQKDADGKPTETPEQMFRRVADNVAQAEILYDANAEVQARADEFYRLMTAFEFLPNSPTLMNAGRDLQQLSACFVLPVEDSIDSIFDAVKHTALIHKSGGGTGFSFSHIRPQGDPVQTTSGVASGPVSFIRVFDAATEAIKQGGTRRGANMAILSVDHPDILQFITSKTDEGAISNFNISVAVTENFMRAVESGGEYDLVSPRTGTPAARLNAKDVFDKIVEMAWRNGEPGVIFIDRMNEKNATPHLGAIESTNPCGEQPLLPYESCNLGSINLAYMVTEQDGRAVIEYERLASVVKTAVRFLDDVIDMNRFPLQEIAERTKATRKIGLGVMGFADMLILLGIPYDSDEALRTGEEVMRFLEEKATGASVELAEGRGVFPAFAGSLYDRPGAPRVRNATRTTIAPTGTLSIIAGCSSGIEPLFALSFTRNILDQEQLVEVNPYFERIARERGFYSDGLMRELARRGSVRGMEGVPEDVQRLFATARDISPEFHVRMQAAFQRHTDNAVSKTVNFPFEATKEDVARVFMLAYHEGCKGITIYRDRSRDRQVLTTAETPSDRALAPAGAAKITPRSRPTTTRGVTEMVNTGCGHVYITVNWDEHGICEVFTTLGKAGGCASAQLEAIGKLISICLRSGVDVESVIGRLRGIRCPSIAWDGGHAVLSCADAIAGVLERRSRGDDGGPEPGGRTYEAYQLALSAPTRNVAGQCPDCSGLLVYAEGCYVCRFCGYTKCG